MQNGDGTREEKWHKSGTGSSPSVRDDARTETQTAAPMAVGNGGDVSTKMEDFAPSSYGISEDDAINLAALWLHLHRSEIVGPIIPAIKVRFSLRNLAAIEALNRAHALAYGGAK